MLTVVTSETTQTSYLHVCELAAGGMGRVDLALRQEGGFRRLYAIKRLHSHLRSDPDFRAMFLEEARIAGLIQHPNVVSVLDVNEDEDGPYLVMNFIAGVSLHKLIQLARNQGEVVPIQVGLRIGIEIARGLHAAHELCDHEGRWLGLVHRDLSPQNVIVSFAGAVRVMDFGIAKALGSSIRTSTGVLKGKMSYMAPEQLRFEEPDRRADLFALGVTLYELLTTRRLYKNQSGNDGVRRLLNEAPPDLGDLRPDAPPALVSLLFDLLSKDRAQRPATARAVEESLDEILGDVAAEEGRLPLEAWTSLLTDELRKERSADVQRAVALAVAAPASVESNSGASAENGMEAPTPRSWPLRSAAAVVILGLGAAGGWIGAQGEGPPPQIDAPLDQSASPRPTQAQMPALPVPVASGPGDSTGVEDLQDSQDDVETPSEAPTLEDDTTSGAATMRTSAGPARARATSTMRRRPRRAPSMSASPMDDSAGVMWYGWSP